MNRAQIAALKPGQWVRVWGHACIVIKSGAHPKLYNPEHQIVHFDCELTGAETKRIRRPRWKITPPEIRTYEQIQDYAHQLFYAPDGEKYLIIAGCRRFTSFTAARTHWRERSRPFDTPEQNKGLNKWSLAWVKRMQALVRAQRHA